MILPIIIAGGTGSRLWPLSRGLHPKQFLKLSGDYTMLQKTIQRFSGLNHHPSILICNEEHRFIAAEQYRQIDACHGGIILEKEGKNTAPAVALAAFHAQSSFKDDPLLLVLAADHDISNCSAYIDSILQAEQLAESGKIVTFGIVPKNPETGYGYIKRGVSIDLGNDAEGYKVEQFVEKPSKEVAERYLDNGSYYWNSGMFLVRTSVYLESLKEFQPEIYKACEASMKNSQLDLDFIRPDSQSFAQCPSDSIDYAVMEPLSEKDIDSIAVVPMDAGWSDVGSFSTLYDVLPKDQDNNVITGDVITHDSENCLLHSDYKMIATVGVSDLVVISTKDAVLVADKNKVQDVKHIVNQLKGLNRSEHMLAREVFRPWGKYDSIDMGDRFQVKRITVKPGEKVSIQMHHHRAEHWVVVKGTALITINGEGKLYSENEAAYIPITATHCMENPGKIDLEIIEVQTGGYLGEDDIIRFEDVYGRANS